MEYPYLTTGYSADYVDSVYDWRNTHSTLRSASLASGGILQFKLDIDVSHIFHFCVLLH